MHKCGLWLVGIGIYGGAGCAPVEPSQASPVTSGVEAEAGSTLESASSNQSSGQTRATTEGRTDATIGDTQVGDTQVADTSNRADAGPRSTDAGVGSATSDRGSDASAPTSLGPNVSDAAALETATDTTDAPVLPIPECRELPCVSRARAVYADQRVSVAFAGWGTVDHFLNVLLEAPAGEVASVSWYSPVGSARFRIDGSYGNVLQLEDGSFAGYITMAVAESPSALTIRLFDTESEEQDSAQIAIGTGAPEVVGAGELCDLEAALYQCPEGLVCEGRDGYSATTCQDLVPECEAADELTALTLDGATGDVSTSVGTNFTLGSCSRQRGDLGNDDAYRFVPQTSGTYRFTFLGQATTLFVRRFCDFPGVEDSELGCASTLEQYPVPDDTQSLEVSLQADVPYFVLVEGGWAGGGAYTLNVEKLP